MIALAGVMALAPIVRAEDTPPAPTTPPANAPAGRPNMREQSEKMFTAIKATDAQKEQLKPILKERTEQMRAMRQDTALSPEDKKTKRKEIFEAADAKVKAVLSPEQFTDYLKFQKEQEKLNQGRRQQPPANN